MERAERLYDCITEIGDAYLQEAEQFQPGKEKILTIHWKRWSSAAAALVLAVGLGYLIVNNLPRMGARASAPSCAPGTAPAASAPAASTPAATEAPAGSAESVPWGNENYGQGTVIHADHYIYKDYNELTQEAAVIVEGTAVSVTPQGKVEEDEYLSLSYTVVEIEVTDVLKGDVEPGNVIKVALLEHVADHPVTVKEGDQSFYFLTGPFDGGTFTTQSLCRCIVPVDGDAVLAEGEMLDQGEGPVSVDKETFKDLIFQAMEN